MQFTNLAMIVALTMLNLGLIWLLLAIPLVVIAKVVSEHVEQLQPVAELLGE